jgi:hypothetical protein
MNKTLTLGFTAASFALASSLTYAAGNGAESAQSPGMASSSSATSYSPPTEQKGKMHHSKKMSKTSKGATNGGSLENVGAGGADGSAGGGGVGGASGNGK